MASSYEEAKREAVEKFLDESNIESLSGVAADGFEFAFNAGAAYRLKRAVERLREMARQWEKEAADRAPVSLQRACDADQRATALERAADLLEKEAVP